MAFSPRTQSLLSCVRRKAWSLSAHQPQPFGTWESRGSVFSIHYNVLLYAGVSRLVDSYLACAGFALTSYFQRFTA